MQIVLYDSAYDLGIKKFRRNLSFSHHFRDKCVFAFYAEIQDGHQNWRETDFWQNLTDEYVYTLGVKNFVNLSLSCTISEIHAFLNFTQKFKMAAKNDRKAMFGKNWLMTADTLKTIAFRVFCLHL